MIRKLFLFLQAIAAFGVLARLAQGARRHEDVEPGSPSAKTRLVSVVIPARNEAERIGPCLEALAREDVLEVIVVDDQSDDDTAAVALAGGAKVIEGKPLPDGYIGKPWALQQGLEASSGEWVIFLDADTTPQPGFVAGALKAAEDSGAHLVSLSARFETNTAVEQTLHASMLATLVYRYGAVGSKTVPTVNRTLANGQCMIARRSWLMVEGGFTSISDKMTDDIAFAREMASRGSKVVFLDGSDVLDVKMYESVDEIWREWGRSLAMPDVTPKRQQWLDVAALWLVLVAPLWMVLTKRASMLDRILLTIRLALCGAFVHAYKGPAMGVYLSPLTDALAAFRITQATLKPVRSWRGREYGQTGT